MGSIFQFVRTGLLTIVWLLLVSCLCILLSAMLPIIPWVRIYLIDIVPNHASWLLIFCLSGLAITILLHAERRTRATRILLPVAAIAVLLAAGVTAHLLYVAVSNGARIDPLQTLSLRRLSDDAGPDESHVYSRPKGEPLRLDVYRGRKPQPRALNPVLVVIHGGGFARGSRTQGAANMRWYADRGWTVVSIDYRLARRDRPTWNLATRDVECALAWTATHAGPLGIDIHRLVLSGGSAGGSLALGAAYASNAERSDPDCGPHVPRVSAVVVKVPLIDAAGSWNEPRELQRLQQMLLSRYIGGSPQRFPARYAALDPTRFLRSDTPPTLILGGSDDPLVPPYGAVAFARKAKAMGRDVRHILFPYSGHDFNVTFGSIPNQAVLQIVVKFMTDHARPAPPARR
ncbi:alpha/beta hydrolase [Sphingomonas sp. BIUV-7]|uniref:Alpha/beta hydrolase n=1 Tax=Sphingomonas natans TaxID=3063330 RepID=A0ABT8YFT1_9SPHN|nr:alpha/beta hydrolase [Sphingomonas sp. BIUV-7]MDO6416773.1 alpha/beta hydrolase [Sphingomonas sp. BIUV-7]